MTDDMSSSVSNRFRDSAMLVCMILLTICAVGAVATVLRTVITPLFISLLLLVLVNPLVFYLDIRRVPRSITYILICIAGAALVIGAGRLVEIQGNELQKRLPEYQERAQAALTQYADTLRIAKLLGSSADGRNSLAAAMPFSQEDVVKYVLGATFELLEFCTMAFFYLLFALMESKRLTKRINRSLSTDSASRLSSVLDTVQHDMRQYLWIKTAISFGLGLTTAALGWVYGLDFWLLWGFLMFIANYVTYIGSIIAIVPPMLIAFAQFESATSAVSLCILLILARLIWIDYAEMRYSGENVNISPLVVLLSVALLGWMWGAVGMLLAVPVVTITRIVLGSFPRTRFLASLISDLKQ
ncbi:MAG: AI-2E family transporter [Aureliella sp.]